MHYICDTNLKTHQRIHTEEKTFQWSNCGTYSTYVITVYSNSDSISYLRTHISPLSVLFCDSNVCSNAKILLKSYYKTHTGYKPYQCIICVTCFTNRTDLKTQQGIHTGEETFHCRYCETYLTDNCILTLCNINETWEKSFQFIVWILYLALIMDSNLKIELILVLGTFLL